jgi:hypothetical protein
MTRYENNAPSLDVLTVGVLNTSGIEVDVPLMSPLSLLISLFSDVKLFHSVHLPTMPINDQLGPVCSSRNFLTHPSFGPVEWCFAHLNGRVRVQMFAYAYSCVVLPAAICLSSCELFYHSSLQRIRLGDMIMVQTDPTLPPRLAQLEGRGWVGSSEQPSLRFSICYVDECALHDGRTMIKREGAPHTVSLRPYMCFRSICTHCYCAVRLCRFSV